MEGIDDRHELYKPYKASCSLCKQGFSIVGFTCKAFPNGIPDQILSGEDSHAKPLKDQGNDIVFESR